MMIDALYFSTLDTSYMLINIVLVYNDYIYTHMLVVYRKQKLLCHFRFTTSPMCIVHIYMTTSAFARFSAVHVGVLQPHFPLVLPRMINSACMAAIGASGIRVGTNFPLLV